jgi:helicase
MKMELPNWLGIVHAENVVFADKRAGVPPEERWNAYANSAQLVLGFVQNVNPKDLPDFYDLKIAVPVIAAARILDSAAAAHQVASKDSENLEDSDTALSYAALAAMAYAILGNFPSAHTVVQRHADALKANQPFLGALLSCAAPSLLGKLYPANREPKAVTTFIDSLEYFLQTASKDAESALRKNHLDLRMYASDSFEASLWLSSCVALNQIIILSTAKTLQPIVGDVQGYWERLTGTGIKTLLPTQFLALTTTQLIQSKTNAVISLPTSTGKTLLSEIAIITGVGEGKIGVFVVPYVALGRQIAQRVHSHLPDGWRLHRMFGGYSEPVQFDGNDGRNFVVATPERLDVLLRSRPDLINQIDCVVFDEAHIIENGDRGMRVESLVTRLLLRQATGVPVRIILVSAVIPNTDLLANWTGTKPESVVSNNWSSSSRRIALWHGGKYLTWYHSGDPLTPEGIEKFKPIVTVLLPWPHDFVPRTGDFAEAKFYEKADAENVAFLLSYLWDKYREPVLCVCATKDMTRRVAAVVRGRFPALDKLGANTTRAITLIAERYRHCLHLRIALESGVAYHNASLPHDLRAAIEDAAADKELRVVVATTTLAEGIDLPFRVTVLADWLGYKNEKQEPLAPLLVRNIAGRCGRAGKFTEGDVVIYDSPLGDRTFKVGAGRDPMLRKTLFSEGDTGISSAANSEFFSHSVRGVIASQFLAAIVENPENENLEGNFYSRLLGARNDENKRISQLINAISKDITSPEWPLASRNSPLAITNLGKAVNYSGFSPSSSRLIAGAMQSAPRNGTPVEIVAFLLAALGDLPEQSNAKFRKLVDHTRQAKGNPTLKLKGRPRLPLSVADLPLVIGCWLAGEQPIDIFSKLPSVAKSTRKPPFKEWLAGLPEPTTWDDQFDKFCDFLGSVLFEFVPWLLRACDLLHPHLEQKPEFLEWATLGQQFRRESDVTDAKKE